MSLLENEKVREFFAPKPLIICACKNGDMCMNHAKDMAYSVLEAMSEPIKKGESYLQAVNRSDWTLLHDCPADVPGFHPFGLRLPSAHQPQRPPSGCERNCSNTHSLLGGNPCPCSCHPWPNVAGNPPEPRGEFGDLIESRIQEIAKRWYVGDKIED